MIGKNKENKPIVIPNIRMEIVLAILRLLTLLFRIALSLGLMVVSAWIVRYFFPFSFFEASVFSIGIWGIVLLRSIRSKLNHLHEHIEGKPDFYDDYEEDDDDEDYYGENDYEEEQHERIQAIFGDREMNVTRENLEIYLEYLKQNIGFPCQLKGVEDFNWEEFYVSSLGNKYKQLQRTRPSYNNSFKLISFNQDIDEDHGILVNVQRVHDKKRFTIPLLALEVTNQESKNYQLLDDYAVWFVTYYRKAKK